MSIKHAFTDPKADGPDTTIVRPSDWNASHTIEDDTVTYAKLQNVSATDKLLGRSAAGAGDVEEIACTAAGRALLDDADAAAQRTTLGLGTAATSATGDFEAAGAIATHAAVASSVHGITAFGASLVDDANAVAARTTLGLAAVAATGAAADLTGLAAVATSGSASDLTAGTLPAGRLPALTGDVTSSAGSAATTITSATVTLAKLADLATQRVIGRNTAGTSVPEAVTATQLLDWASSTNGALLTRTAGSWAAAGNAAIHGGDLALTASDAPTTPGAGTVKEHGVLLSGRPLLGIVGPDGLQLGISSVAQPHTGRQHPGWAFPTPGTNNHTVLGMPTLTFAGTATSRSLAATTLITGARRMGLVSATSAGSATGLRCTTPILWRGNAAGAGGFHFLFRWAITDPVLVTDARMFVGLSLATTAPTDVEPTTLTNIIGVGCNASDTVMQLYGAAGAAQTRASLGANFPVNTTGADIYELSLYCVPNGSEIRYQLTRLDTGHITSGAITDAARMPASTTLLTVQAWRSNNATAAACSIDWTSLYLETEF